MFFTRSHTTASNIRNSRSLHILTAIATMISLCILVGMPPVRARAAGEIYQFTQGFSSTQGLNQWYYKYFNGSSYGNMTWQTSYGGSWVGNASNCLIGNGWVHPDLHCEAVIAWKAPRNGNVTIVGTMDRFDYQGDGVMTRILQNSTQKWPSSGWQVLTPRLAARHIFQVSVAANDYIYFHVNQNGNNSYDRTDWNPIITYDASPQFVLDKLELVADPQDFSRMGIPWMDSSLSTVSQTNGNNSWYHSFGAGLADIYKLSEGFSSSQGNEWFYQYKVGNTYANMNWQSSYGGSWVGNESLVLISNGWLHPGTNADAALKWIAPRTGTVQITGKPFDEGTGCDAQADGVQVSILKGATSLWVANINNGDTIGQAHSLSVTVSAGEAIYFVVNKQANNGCDRTNWNPTVMYASVPIKHQLSEGFASSQGQNHWFYQYKVGNTYADMNWQSSYGGSWVGNESLCIDQ